MTARLIVIMAMVFCCGVFVGIAIMENVCERRIGDLLDRLDEYLKRRDNE